MKHYKLRSDVVLLTIEGEHLLVATKDARKDCPYVTQINDAAAVYWPFFEHTATFPEVMDCVCKELQKDRSEIFMPLMAFVNKMKQAGYLLEEETV